MVLQEYEPSPKLCLENFHKAKRNHDETVTQFASRLTSIWAYYCKLREVKDFKSVNHLIVEDKMFQVSDTETAIHVVYYKEKNDADPRIYFTLQRGSPMRVQQMMNSHEVKQIERY
ncbi:hypothetical protein AVEN_268177-1 [Araneus ventricosus]|uniref:Uncharacterized protein n=1 Tax=Araneus ventricosus TaxID=182803 RepID=A0A4Y2MA62_ARAVE|nr:hypothetical protein AVEN_268177-1 [Araneus ventricosus]